MIDTTAIEAFFAWLTSMRETDPVHEDEHGAWHLFSHENLTRALSDPATFSSDTSSFLPDRPEMEPFANRGSPPSPTTCSTLPTGRAGSTSSTPCRTHCRSS